MLDEHDIDLQLLQFCSKNSRHFIDRNLFQILSWYVQKKIHRQILNFLFIFPWKSTALYQIGVPEINLENAR